MKPLTPARRRELRRRTFKAATWNVYYGTKPGGLRPHLRAMRRNGVSLFLLQELSNADTREMIRAEGLRLTFVRPQLGIAWDPTVWQRMSAGENTPLATTAYYREGGSAPQEINSCRIILRHRPSGRTVDALSYHTPAGVDRKGGPSKAVPRRVQALRESMLTLGRLARQKRADAVLYGGDDNVDERHGTAWGFMLKAATGLRQVNFPAGTHHKRAIDDFRVKGLAVIGKGYDVENPSDHDAHVRSFRFRK